MTGHVRTEPSVEEAVDVFSAGRPERASLNGSRPRPYRSSTAAKVVRAELGLELVEHEASRRAVARRRPPSRMPSGSSDAATGKNGRTNGIRGAVSKRSTIANTSKRRIQSLTSRPPRKRARYSASARRQASPSAIHGASAGGSRAAASPRFLLEKDRVGELALMERAKNRKDLEQSIRHEHHSRRRRRRIPAQRQPHDPQRSFVRFDSARIEGSVSASTSRGAWPGEMRYASSRAGTVSISTVRPPTRNELVSKGARDSTNDRRSPAGAVTSMPALAAKRLPFTSKLLPAGIESSARVATVEAQRSFADVESTARGSGYQPPSATTSPSTSPKVSRRFGSRVRKSIVTAISSPGKTSRPRSTAATVCGGNDGTFSKRQESDAPASLTDTRSVPPGRNAWPAISKCRARSFSESIDRKRFANRKTRSVRAGTAPAFRQRTSAAPLISGASKSSRARIATSGRSSAARAESATETTATAAWKRRRAALKRSLDTRRSSSKSTGVRQLTGQTLCLRVFHS